MKRLTEYSEQVKEDSHLSEDEQKIVAEYKRQIKVVEHQRNAVEKGLSGDMRALASDAGKYYKLEQKDHSDVLAEKKKEAALRAAVDKKLAELRHHDELVDKRNVSAAQVADKKAFEAEVKKAVAAALEKANSSSRNSSRQVQ